MLDRWIVEQVRRGNEAGAQMGRTLQNLYGDVALEKSSKEPLNNPKVPLARIAEALTFETHGNTRLLTQITGHFNKTLGSELDDQTPIDDLRLPEGMKKVLVLGADLKVAILYVRAINVARRPGTYKTVGDLRRAEYGELMILRNSGPEMSNFLIGAFRRI